MLLTDKIIYKKNLDFKHNNRVYIIDFSYTLEVHNYDAENALISLHILCRGDLISSKNYYLFEFDELKIPHKLTAKEWIESLIFHHDPSLKRENKSFNNSPDLTDKIIEFLTRDFKFKSF